VSVTEGSAINLKDIVCKTGKANSREVALIHIGESLQTPQHIDLIKNWGGFGIVGNTHFE
jgi:hypothetical protein